MIDEQLSKQATFEDGILLKSAHPLGFKLLTYAGEKWRLKKLPFAGTIISDESFIREVLMDKTRFNKDRNPNFWKPIIMGDTAICETESEDQFKLERIVSSFFSKERTELITGTVISSILDEITSKIEGGESVDMVEAIERISYLSVWHIVGLSAEKLRDIDFNLAVRTLRSVTAGQNQDRKTAYAQDKPTFLEELIREAFTNDNRESLPLALKKESYSEETAVSLTLSLFLAVTETVISALPRIVALFLKSRYIDYLSENRNHVTHGVEEALRVIVPNPVTVYSVSQPTEFHGAKLKSGERLILSTFGASKRFGDFNPFEEVSEDIRDLWFNSGMTMRTGINLTLIQAEILCKFLAQINSEYRLEVSSQASDDKGHAGNYKQLMITGKSS